MIKPRAIGFNVHPGGFEVGIAELNYRQESGGFGAFQGILISLQDGDRMNAPAFIIEMKWGEMIFQFG